VCSGCGTLSPVDELIAQFSPVVLMLAASILSWAAVESRKWIQRRVDNEYVRDLLIRLETGIEAAVRDAAQGIVATIKEAAADGKITPAERAQILESVRKNALEQLTRVDLARLEELFDRDHLERKLDVLIEAAVQKLKGN